MDIRYAVAGLVLVILPTTAQYWQGDSSSESLQEVDRVKLLEAVPDTALAVVSDYLVTDAGRIYVSDPQYSRILILERDTGYWRTVGRKGQGPGEFLLPDRLNVVGDSLLIWDRLNERMSYYTRDGDFLSIVRPSPGISQIFEVTPTPDGGLVVPTWGLGREHLITWYSKGLQDHTGWGQIQSEPSAGLQLGLTRSEARRKVIPDAMKDRALGVPTSDDGMVIVHTAVPVFEKYNSDGELLWKTEHDSPEMSNIRNHVFQQVLDEDGPRRYSVKYWQNGVPDSNGGCYLLMWHVDHSALFHLTSDGNLSGPMQCPSGRWHMLRRFNGHLWLLGVDTLEIVELNVVSSRSGRLTQAPVEARRTKSSPNTWMDLTRFARRSSIGR